MSYIDIYPAFDPRYYAYYIEGLHELVGRAKLRYTSRGFPRFGIDCLALRVGGADGRRIFINSRDALDLDPDGLEWCDVFAKVNLDRTLVPDGCGHKMYVPGPNFPLRIWGWAEGVRRTVVNTWSGRRGIDDIRRHIGWYRQQHVRFYESEYRPGVSRPDYVFFNAALWEREPEANTSRANFIQACQSIPDLRFEGGLTPRDSARGTVGYRPPEFEQFIGRRFTPREYLDNTKASAVAFNNPAYRKCHSWRLGEYLAMGKAIISLPLAMEMPSPLQHGVHVHYVDGSVAAIQDALEQICGDRAYRARLERSARAYHEEYLAPARMMERILARADVPVSAWNRPVPDPAASEAGAVTLGPAHSSKYPRDY